MIIPHTRLGWRVSPSGLGPATSSCFSLFTSNFLLLSCLAPANGFCVECRRREVTRHCDFPAVLPVLLRGGGYTPLPIPRSVHQSLVSGRQTSVVCPGPVYFVSRQLISVGEYIRAQMFPRSLFGGCLGSVLGDASDLLAECLCCLR